MILRTRLKLAAAIAFLALLLTPGTAQAVSRAGLVIIHGDGTRVTRVVPFSGAALSGIELLRRSGMGISVQKGSAGEAVYMIDGEGDPNGWVTRDGRNYFWSYFQLRGGRWRYSSLGAGQTTVKNGQVDAWVWQYYGADKLPPTLTFGQLAGVATATVRKTVKTAGSAGQRLNYLVWLGLIVVLAGILYVVIRRPRRET